MNKKLLEINDLSIAFGDAEPITQNISFKLSEGGSMALVGESGSGKSITALSIMGLLKPSGAKYPEGEIIFDGKNILNLNENDLIKIRGKDVGMIFQEPMTSLNPLHNLGKQLSEAITLHKPSLKKSEIKNRINELLNEVDLSSLKNRLNAYPHELSGGQRQRIMIAMALANEPKLLIADEPTTALDVTVQATILDLIKHLQKKFNMALLLITHDLTIIEKMVENIAVMKDGKIVEQGIANQILKQPKHEYTKKLINGIPSGAPHKISGKKQQILSTKDLSVKFPIKKNFFGHVVKELTAADKISINLNKGETLGIVGESGSGKSTLVKAILRLIKSKGDIILNGKDISVYSQKDLKILRSNIQMVFQDPFSSLNPRMNIGQVISEGLTVHHNLNNDEKNKLVSQMLEKVGLKKDIISRYPHEFSGGQRQRICIARSLILNPEILVLDEPTSALDVSTQAEILDLLKNLQKELGLSYLFISHDLRVIKAISHNVLVMHAGKEVEYSKTEALFKEPKDEYTKNLISAAFG